MRAVTPDEMRSIEEAYTNETGLPLFLLMERAAEALLREIRKTAAPGRIYIFAGGGNNGGDGWALARLAAGAGYDAAVIPLAENGGGIAGMNRSAAEALGIKTIPLGEINNIERDAVIVDAMLGTGLQRPLSGAYEAAAKLINSSGAYVIAADIASGVNGATGEVGGTAVYADKTVTFGFPKAGQLLYPGRDYTGELIIADIGLAPWEPSAPEKRTLTDADMLRRVLPQRRRNTHKGSYGHVLIAGGSTGMLGAVKLCAASAMRTGAGLASIALPEDICRLLQADMLEGMCIPLGGTDKWDEWLLPSLIEAAEGKDAIAIGPGMGKSKALPYIIGGLLPSVSCPIVLDADGLNAASKNRSMLTGAHGSLVLTPHPMEFSRLTGLPISEILSSPEKYALQYAREWNCTVLLKGSTTVIASEAGNVAYQTAGNPGMATGGSGDCLTGIIAALLARGITPFEAAACGAYIHALAGDEAARLHGENGMTAADISENIGPALLNALGK